MNIISEENVLEMGPEAGQVVEMNPQTGQAMQWNDEANKALPDIFGNPLILNLILDHLPNPKLLQLSLVSKLWKKEARFVMKKRGNVMALLNCNRVRECGKVFRDFVANLETLDEGLYSGMTIWLLPFVDCGGSFTPLEVEAIHGLILAGLRGKLKRLSIRLENPEFCWNFAPYCANFVLLRRLLTESIGDLEHLTLEIEKVMEPFIQEFLPLGPYPKLKVVKLIDPSDPNGEAFDNQIRTILSRAPDLEEIHTKGCVSLSVNLMEGREGVLHVHESMLDDPMEDISENVIPALRLKRIKFIYTTELELNLYEFNEKAQSLLRTCCATTLEDLRLDRVSAMLFISYGIPLVNVKDLRIFFDYLKDDPRIRNILSHFDFTYLFPHLKKVVYDNRYLPEKPRDNMMEAIIEQANLVRSEPTTLLRAENIKCLKLRQDSIPTSALQFFSRMFPAIEKLEVRAEDLLFSVEPAWELWPDLNCVVDEGDWYWRP